MVKLPPGHKFPTVKVTNPMMFAITFARSAARGGDKDSKKKAIKDTPSGAVGRSVRPCVLAKYSNQARPL